MSNIDKLIKLILQIKGVTHYIFVREDGYILSHNYGETDALSAMIVFSGLNCHAIKPVLGLGHFRYMSYTLENNEKLLIFPIGRYLLGISQDSESYTPDVVERMERLIEAVTPKK